MGAFLCASWQGVGMKCERVDFENRGTAFRSLELFLNEGGIGVDLRRRVKTRLNSTLKHTP